MRISAVGEPGYELHARVEYGEALWRTLWEAGTEHGLVAGGSRARESLRLESGHRAWGTDVSSLDTPLWTAISDWVAETEPGAKLAPLCCSGFTDSHWLREAFGTVAYGFFPARAMEAETAARLIHSADERVPVDDLELGVSFLRAAAQSLLRA